MNSIIELRKYVANTYPDLQIHATNESLTISSNTNYDIPYRINQYKEQQLNRQKEKEIEQLNIDKYLNEFDLLKYKSVTKMSDFTFKEEKMWRQTLDIIYDGEGLSDGISDLFNEHDLFDERYVTIVEWSWKHNGKIDILIDLYGYPGDNQAGIIFMNDELVLINHDQEIGDTINSSDELIKRIPAFEHIRMQQCVEDQCGRPNPKAHKHCVTIRERMC